MQDYDYSNQYQTTSYGAQGGAGGGGFLNQYGSQPGSQTTPSKTYGKDTLRPVTIRQLLHALHPHPDAEFKVDGSDITQITFVGQIRNVSTQTTNVTYKLDDGTAIIEAKVWNDAESTAMDGPEAAKPKLVEGTYVRVWGKMKAFNNKRTVAAHFIRRIEDHNEVQCHLLEATVVHLYFTRGPPNQVSKGGPDAMKGDGTYGYEGGQYAADPSGPGQMGRTLPHLSNDAGRVYEVLRTYPQNNEGLHSQFIAAHLGMPVNDVLKAGDELQGQSLIYSTVDDETWAILEA